MCILTLKKECQRIHHQTWYFVTEWVPFVTGTAGRVSVTAHTEDSRTAEISGGKRQGSAAPWRQQGEHWTGGNQVDISWSTRCIMTLLWMVEPRDEKPSQGWKKADVNYDAVYVRVTMLASIWLYHVMRMCPRGLTFTWWGCCSLCFWHKPTELAHLFLFCSCVCFCLYCPFNCISFNNSPDNSPLSHSLLPVLFLPYWSFQQYIFSL